MKQETQNFIKLSVHELAKKSICDGHVYLVSGERKFYVMKPGIFIDQDFVKKHAARNQIFDFSSPVNPEIYQRFKDLFRELRELQFEKDLRTKCFEITKFFQESFAAGEHFLSFALACHEEFCQIPQGEQLQMHETDMHLFRKALYSASFSVIVGITNDFYHFLMLRDFYNLTFCLDIGLCSENYSYFVATACNTENQVPGKGMVKLEAEKASELEKKVFHEHPQKSYEVVKRLNFLSYPELAEIVLYQHELSDGSGFPRGLRKGHVSSWEAVVIFSDALVEILPEYKFETQVLQFLTTFENRKLKQLPVQRVFKRMSAVFAHMEHEEETGT